MYCSACGNENEEAARFCANCGKPIGSNDAIRQSRPWGKIILVVVVVVLVLLGVLGEIVTNSRDSRSNNTVTLRTDSGIREMSLPEALKMVADELSQSAPVRIDADTEVQSVFASGTTLNLRYRIVGLTSQEIDTNVFLQEMNMIARNSLCSSPIYEGMWDHGLSMVNTYYDKNNQYIGKVTVAKEECER